MSQRPPTPDQEPIRPSRIEILDAHGRPVGSARPEPPRPPRPVFSQAVVGVCVVVFIVFNVLLGHNREYLYSLTFSPGNGLVVPGILTSMFAHADILHLLFNMLVLYFLGTLVELRYGARRYAVLFLGSGMFASLAQAAILPGVMQLGASGALAGVMAAFVRHYPHLRLYIWGILPIPAWLAMALWMGYNIYFSIGARGDDQGIAFMAHIAGFAAGIVISLLLEPPAARPRRRGYN